MSEGETKNSALTTAMAFHYQALIGVEQCFNMKEGQSVWFERDGDISLVAPNNYDATQFEVKKYGDSLTDHHKNFWKTLKNWLAPEFKHDSYGSLVLHTTQAFGSTSLLSNWNNKAIDDRLVVIKTIFATHTPEKLDTEKPKSIVQLQKDVINADNELLKAVLAKVYIHTEADDLEALRANIKARFNTIPMANRDRCLERLVGFVYECANENLGWAVHYEPFSKVLLEIGSNYYKKKFPFPRFEGKEASNEELDSYSNKLFVTKINEIEHYEMIPEAVGNWIELNNSLSEELDGAPLYKDSTNQYQKMLIKKLKLNHSTAKLTCSNPIQDSKIFYNKIIEETPPPMELYNPPLEYKNGLIHDAMDNESSNLQWKVGS